MNKIIHERVKRLIVELDKLTEEILPAINGKARAEAVILGVHFASEIQPKPSAGLLTTLLLASCQLMVLERVCAKSAELKRPTDKPVDFDVDGMESAISKFAEQLEKMEKPSGTSNSQEKS